MELSGARLGSRDPFRPTWGVVGAFLGSSWRHLSTFLGLPGAVLAPSWAVLGSSWAVSGPLQGLLGRLGPM
eukprot:3347389-Pyramimonas_sp.AAC.1